jgi:HSP20 family protein
MPERDLFGNFDRMRRDVDELLGGVLERTGIARGAAGFAPAVDVYYCGEPSTVVVKAELAGVDVAELRLEIHGRELVISGQRPIGDSERRSYQQIEIEHGPFRRVVALGADVDADAAKATYENGILRVELPIAAPRERRRTVPVEVPRAAGGS